MNSEAIELGMNSCLVTGGNGYLGKHIVDHFCAIGWKVKTLGRSIENTYCYDLSINIPSFIEKFDVIIHCAGKAHSFPKTLREEEEFFDVNTIGTKNLLKALEEAPSLPKTVVFISSVSVYGVSEGTSFCEETPLYSKHPYGKSKIAAEGLMVEWCKKNSVTYLILRLPLLAGKKPPGNLASMIKAISKGYYFNIQEQVRKSIVMADDVAKIIPSAINIGGVYNLTDGYHPTIKELAILMADQLGNKHPRTIPIWLGKMLLSMVDKLSFISKIRAYKFKKLASTLTFDDTRARQVLGWKPNRVIENFIIK
ncbi:NAD(P)-dependent oxidoreductase [Pedobacter sp. ASV28]|uniref:NAD-dependent epimerase/dehydratase family protein n=1 Tax=Pedobacter sp. ASV28 TaxID=2795123 RepID=UPI001E555998|nr:NAD-dependent epimerase/dehydratase family protein [Pedobacter sp. ASV28]